MESTHQLAALIRNKRGAWKAEVLAEFLDCSKKSIYAWVKQRQLPAIRIGSIIRSTIRSTRRPPRNG
ncbi:helix-turn-helix domain-containing protein [Edaphobacter paludis]|uniref:helix-turn-helix domain-containing protein n=1 Tax=Edaphobacter paludis TaxID=3035702 RepID=UPI00359FA7A1